MGVLEFEKFKCVKNYKNQKPNVFVAISRDWIEVEQNFKECQNRIFELVKMHSSYPEKSERPGRDRTKTDRNVCREFSRMDNDIKKIQTVPDP